jgi:serine phosphatase RsbU (regulator of sigma subunit)
MAESFLEMKSGPHDGERFPLVKERTVIGRHPSCDIVIEESAASRHHAAVTFTGTGFAIEDLGSRNGTLLNGRRLVGTHELELGDELVISGQQMAFVSDSPAIIGSARVSGTIQEEILEASGGEAMIVSQVDLPRPSPHNPAGGQAEAKLRAVLGFNRAIGASLSLEDVLPRLLEGVFGIYHQADRAFVLLADKESKRLVLRARKIKGAPEPGPLRLSLSLIDRVVRSGKAILSADALTDSRFNASESIHDCRIRSVMCVPVLHADGSVLGVIHVDSLGAVGGFTQEDLEVLAGVAGQAAQAIEQALAHDEQVGRAKLKRDLEIAHRVQQGLLPSQPPDIPGYEVFDYYESAQQVGGDFFGYVPLAEGRIAVVLADVSGKGVSAALVMAALSADVRYCLASERDVPKAVARINESFCRSGWDERFATAVVAVLDPATHRAELVCAGHLPVYLRHADGTVQAVGPEQGGLPLGMDPQAVYSCSELEFAPGTIMVFYTDGISEAMDHEDNLYGLERLLSVVEGTAASAGELGRRILADVERHAAGQVRSDDICLVCVGRPLPGSASTPIPSS